MRSVVVFDRESRKPGVRFEIESPAVHAPFRVRMRLAQSHAARPLNSIGQGFIGERKSGKRLGREGRGKRTADSNYKLHFFA